MFKPKFSQLRLEPLEQRLVLSVDIAWTTVGNPGNPADTTIMQDGTTGWGSVGYSYQIDKFDVTNGQYTDFLNAKDPTGADPLGLWNSSMELTTSYGFINYNPDAPDGSKYTDTSGTEDYPVVNVTWYDAIRFANWMNNGQGDGDTETGAYTILGGTPTPSNGDSITRNADATIALPSENEWYKAAYYDPTTTSYFIYPTSSNTPPTDTSPTSAPNSVNAYPGGPYYPTNVGAYSGTTSPYGLYDMGGNSWQWNEGLIDGTLRELRGGQFKHPVSDEASDGRGHADPTEINDGFGFRVVMLPELVTASGTTNTFTVGGAAMAVDSGVMISTYDVDLTGATMTISADTLQTGDILNFTNQNGIGGSYSNGLLTLSGNATPAQYQAALQSVTFSTTSTNTTTRAISIVVSDSTLASGSVAEQVDVSTILPELVASGTTNTFTVGGVAVAVDAGLAGSPSGTDLTGATLTISSGTLQSGDALNFVNQDGISGSYASGGLTLSGVASVSQYVAALQSVTFSTTNVNQTPRAISIVALDGTLQSTAALEQVNVTVAPPVVTPSGATGNYLVGGAAIAVDSGVMVSSYDTDLTGATVTISAGTLDPGDVLIFANQNGISGGYAGGVLTLSGTATPAQYQAALESVTFSSTTTNPAFTTRAISIVALDNGLISNAAAESLNVGRTFVLPSGLTTNYTSGAPAVVVDPGIKVTSSDSDITGATMTIANYQAGDALNYAPIDGIGAASNSGGVLTLTGTATPAQYQAALRSVTFSSISTSIAARSISVVGIDNNINSNTAAETINVSAPITITQAYVKGSAWQSTFLTYLGNNSLGNSSFGYALKTGSSQLTDLPFNNINTIVLSFSGAVSDIGQGSLKLVGGTGTGAAVAPSITGFTSLGSNTYSWTLSGSLGNNKYVVALATTGSSFGTAGTTQVVDSHGAGISGKFVTSSSTFPSGNGLAGSTFDFFFNVLPGDANQNGAVATSDTALVRPQVNKRSTQAGYSPYYDYNGAGVIGTTDIAIDGANTNARNSTITAPAAPAAAPVGGSGFTALALGVQESGSSSSRSTAPAVSNFTPTTSSSTSASASSTGASSKSDSGSGGSRGTSDSTISRDHGRHHFGDFGELSRAATDKAVGEFDLSDLFT